MSFNKEKAREAIYKRWETKKGVKVLLYVKPTGARIEMKATCRGEVFKIKADSVNSGLQAILTKLKDNGILIKS